MLTVKQAVLRRHRRAGEIMPPPYSLHALNQRFQPGRHCLHGLLDTLYRGAGGWEMPDRDTVKLSRDFYAAGWHAFGANVEVLLHRDGTVRLKCRTINTSDITSYEYAIKIIVATASGMVVFMVHSGQRGINNAHTHHETMHNPLVADHFDAFINSWLETSVEYTDSFTATVEDCLTFIGNWIIGLAIMPNPVAALVVFLGTEAISLIGTGSLNAGARLAAGYLWMKGPLGTFFSLASMAIARIGSRRRRLHAEEYDWANTLVFGGSLPPIGDIWLTDTSIGDHAFVWPEPDGSITLNMGADAFDDPRTRSIGMRNALGREVIYGEIFVHELVHAWQIRHSPRNSAFMAQALAEYISHRGSLDAYRYEANPQRPFHDYNIEQQASIVSDWYNRHFRGGPHDRLNFNPAPTPQQDPNWRYIAYDIRPAR